MLFPYHDDNPTRRFPIFTIVIIAINVLMLLYKMNLDEPSRRMLELRYGFIPARIQQLQDPATTLTVDLYPGLSDADLDEYFGSQDWTRAVEFPGDRASVLMSLLTCMFLHAGIVHLLGNMWFLWIFGNNIEDRLGHVVFLLFYLLGGLAASTVHWAMTGPDGANVPVIGASGAVAVVLGAYAVTYPKARVRCVVFLFLIFFIELPAMIVLGVWILGQVVSAWSEFNLGISGGVALWAHIGGFVAGAIVMPLLSSVFPDDDAPVRSGGDNGRPSSRPVDPATRWQTPMTPRNDPQLPKHDDGIRWVDE